MQSIFKKLLLNLKLKVTILQNILFLLTYYTLVIQKYDLFYNKIYPCNIDFFLILAA